MNIELSCPDCGGDELSLRRTETARVRIALAFVEVEGRIHEVEHDEIDREVLGYDDDEVILCEDCGEGFSCADELDDVSRREDDAEAFDYHLRECAFKERDLR